MYDLIIIGGGPGGAAAGIYAARKAIKTAIIYDSFGGQSLVSADIQNWIGTKSISGFEFGKMLEEHLRAQGDAIEICDSDLVSKVSSVKGGFQIETKKGKIFETKTVLVVSGSRRRKLGVPGEERLDGKGVVYCSTCDAPIFKNKKVAVVGGGNAGLEAVLDLLPYASEIHLLEYTDVLKGDAVTQAKVKLSPKVKVIFGALTKEILGDKFVSSLKYEDRGTGAIRELKVEGVFIEIGSIPNADFVSGLVEINKFGEIVVDPLTERSSREGIWAAGDVTNEPYKQNNIAAGDAIKAVLNIYEYLNKT